MASLAVFCVPQQHAPCCCISVLKVGRCHPHWSKSSDNPCFATFESSHVYAANAPQDRKGLQ